MRNYLIIRYLVIAAVIFNICYWMYPEFLWFIESNSFFSTCPDFTALQLSLPEDLPEYIASFLSQFYRWEIVGACIHTLLAMVVLFLSDFIVWRVTRNKGMLWISIIPVSVLFFYLFQDSALLYAVRWGVSAILLSAVVMLCTIRKGKRILLEKSYGSKLLFSNMVSCALLFCAVYFVSSNEEWKERESILRLERYAYRDKWDAILKETAPGSSRFSSLKLRYTLLALNRKGVLPELLFKYPIRTVNDFLFERQDEIICRNFQAVLFNNLGCTNEAVHNTFQAGISSYYGMSFRTLRTLTDMAIRSRHVELAEKYLKILQHTHCHDRFIRNRLPILDKMKKNEDIRTENHRSNPFFIGARGFMSDMAHIVDRNPGNRMATDYLLCGLLVEGNLNTFAQAFSHCYSRMAKNIPLPRYYEEALLMLSLDVPNVLQKYQVSEKRLRDFQEFMSGYRQGGEAFRMQQMKYGDSYWNFFIKNYTENKPTKNQS